MLDHNNCANSSFPATNKTSVAIPGHCTAIIDLKNLLVSPPTEYNPLLVAVLYIVYVYIYMTI